MSGNIQRFLTSIPMSTPAPPAVARLRTLGDPARLNDAWPDYATEHGLTGEDVPALIDVALDDTPYAGDDPAAWAPVHAWRALGQLGAPEAAEPLTRLLARLAESDANDDWGISELPHALALLGPAAFAPLHQLLDDTTRDVFVRGAAATTLGALAARSPEGRTACVDALVAVLTRDSTPPDLAAFAVAALVDAKAVEAAPAIEAAFAAERVELSINGDWEDVQLALDLITERRTPRPRYVHPGLGPAYPLDDDLGSVDRPPPNSDVGTAARRKRERAKAKAQRKAASRARQANRRRKR